MIRTIIIDDEQHCIDRLSGMLTDHCKKEVLLMDSFSSFDDGIKGIERLQPQLVFLDVQIKDKTGFELLKQVSDLNFDVIFTTAYEKFAVQAFKFSATDFLLKPIVAEDLLAAIQKLNNKLSLTEKAKKFETLFFNVSESAKRIAIPTVTGFTYLNTSDILRCESDVNYTTIYLKDKTSLMVAKTLKEFEEMLRDFGFFRIHNSHLINIAYIKSYNKGKGGYVTLTDNKQIEVSTRRKDEFLSYLEKNH
jgi:two-component system LytT family response regulator